MGLLVSKLPETLIADNMLGSKVLKLGRVRARLTGQAHEIKSSIQLPIVIGCEVSDEVGFIRCTKLAAINLQFACPFFSS